MSLNSDEDELDLEPAERPQWPEPEFDLPLRKPLDLPDGPVDSLRLREPTGFEWEQIMATAVATRRRFAVSLIAGIPMKACGQIGIGDLVRAEEYLNGFFAVGRTIGVS
jgi:hypothetical protein